MLEGLARPRVRGPGGQKEEAEAERTGAEYHTQQVESGVWAGTRPQQGEVGQSGKVGAGAGTAGYTEKAGPAFGPTV